MLLEACDVTMEFENGTKALQSVNLKVGRGEVHGLIGENGAGKSTLIKIISAALAPTTGSIRWQGDPVRWNGPIEARRAGIRTIYQNIPLVPTLTVLENVLLDQQGLLPRVATSRRSFQRLVDRLGYQIDPDQLVGDLPIGDRQMVAILQALAAGAQLIIMDEPTASLSNSERQIVFRAVKRLSETGTTFLYVSHFLDEILSLTGSVTALRDGRVTLSAKTAALDYRSVVAAVAGRQLDLAITRTSNKESSRCILLRVNNLQAMPPIRDVSLEVYAGEVVGLAGLLGSGRSELLRAIFGADPRRSGQVLVDGRVLAEGTRDAVRSGLAFVPEDRRDGAVAVWPIWMNCSLPYLANLSHWQVIPKRRAERDRAERLSKALNIKSSDVDDLVESLSGGNAQKVVVAKWFEGDARVFLFDDPTVGVDIAAKTDIVRLLRNIAASGKGVVVASSDFVELLSVSDRILVMRNGQFVAERMAISTSESELLELVGGWDEPTTILSNSEGRE